MWRSCVTARTQINWRDGGGGMLCIVDAEDDMIATCVFLLETLARFRFKESHGRTTTLSAARLIALTDVGTQPADLPAAIGERGTLPHWCVRVEDSFF